MSYKIKIQPSNVSYQSENNLLDDALSQSIPLEHSCKNGDCGVCSAEIISGEILNESAEVVTQGSILTCQSKALSDAILKANYYPELANIKQQTLPSKVSTITYAAEDILILKLRFPPTVQFKYLAGQYIDLIFKGIKRSYSIANACNNSKEIELHIRKVLNGSMSELLFDNISENQLMRIEGPKGTFFVRDGIKPLIFLATGTGIAPVKAMVEALLESNDKREIHIYWGMRFQSEIYSHELKKYSQMHSHIKFISVLSRECSSDPKHGYVQDAVLNDVESINSFDVYACGSLTMIEQAKLLFVGKGLSSESFYSDAFTPAK